MDGKYVSCPFIENSLVFALGNLCLCCITNHGKGYPKVGDYEGGELPLDRILAFREEVRSKNQNDDRYPSCSGCGYLEERAWEPAPHPFSQIIIAHFTQCNLRCKYCYVLRHGYLENPYLPYDLVPVLKSMLEDGLLSPDGRASWGGGEPVVYEGFERTFKLLLDHGIYQDVNTNGTIVSPVLKEALLQKRARLTCGVDAGTAVTYERIKGRDRFDLVWRNLEDYAATGGEVAAKIIVMRENHDEVVRFLERAKDAGIRSILYDVNFFDLEQPDEVVDAIALLIKEATAESEIRIAEGGGGIASFGEGLRARIRKSMDKTVTWKELIEKRNQIEALREDIHSLQERILHLEQSRSIRISQGFRKKYPLLMQAASKSFSWLEKIRSARSRGLNPS